MVALVETTAYGLSYFYAVAVAALAVTTVEAEAMAALAAATAYGLSYFYAAAAAVLVAMTAVVTNAS